MDKHKTLETADILSLIGELEHARRHAIRSAHTTKDDDKKVQYEITATRMKEARRNIMGAFFPEVADEDWCLVKTMATIRQLMYEVGIMGDDADIIEQTIDEIYTQALGTDMSGCVSCKEDR